MSPYLKLETNFLIFLFYTGLSKAYDSYFTYYIQNHQPMSETNTIKPAYTLKYTTSRFIQTVTNPSSERTESNFAMLAEAYPFTSASRSPVVIELQNGAVPSLEAQIIQKLVKYYLYCKKYYYIKAECDLLNPKGRNNGKSLGGNRGENNKGNGGGKGNKGGRKLSKDNKDKDKNKKDKSSKDKYSRKRRRNDTNSDTENEIYIAFSAEVDGKPEKQAIDTACSTYSTSNREIFIEYRHLDLKVDDIRPIKGINGSRTPLEIGKVRLSIVTDRRKKDLILTNVLHVLGIPLNLIS